MNISSSFNYNLVGGPKFGIRKVKHTRFVIVLQPNAFFKKLMPLKIVLI